MMEGEETISTLQDALSRASADQAEIVAERLRQGVTRYAGSRIHQTSYLDTTRVWVRAVVGQSVGHASGDSADRDSVSALLQRATAVARIQAPNPEFVSLPAPEPPVTVAGYDAATAAMNAVDRADAIGTIVEATSVRGWTASGTFLTEARELTAVNSLGIAAYAPGTAAYLRALPDSGRGTGYAAAWSHRAADIDPEDVARRAVQRCEQNRDQREIEPGEYEAIFEDLCVAEALLYLGRHGFNGQSFHEGTSFLSGRMGERVTGSNVTIWDDGTDPAGLAVAADYEGVPKRRVSLLEAGIARGVTYDSDTAQRYGTRSTGHASEPDWRFYGPTPMNLYMEGGNASVDDMIRATKRGLLLTRFHYTHCPDPRRVVMTGTTRDGTLLIENGEIVGAVRNLRLTQSIPDLFEGIEMAGTPRLCRDWWSSNGMGRPSYVCPSIKVRRAVFSSGTLF